MCVCVCVCDVAIITSVCKLGCSTGTSDNCTLVTYTRKSYAYYCVFSHACKLSLVMMH